MKDIKIVRLNNTEQIVGTILEETPDKIVIEFPMEIITDYNGESDQHQLHGLKWSPFSNDTILELRQKDVLCLSTPKSELVEYYNNKINKLYYENSESNDEYSEEETEEEYYESLLKSLKKTSDDTEH